MKLYILHVHNLSSKAHVQVTFSPLQLIGLLTSSCSCDNGCISQKGGQGTVLCRADFAASDPGFPKGRDLRGLGAAAAADGAVAHREVGVLAQGLEGFLRQAVKRHGSELGAHVVVV